MTTFTAYCWANGKIQIGKKTPNGAIPLASSTRHRLRKALTGICRFAYNNKTMLVPGVPEAEMMGYDPVQKTIDFSNRLQAKLQ